MKEKNTEHAEKQAMKAKTKANMAYTPGELNRLVDSVCHPLCDADVRFIILDGFLHALVEQDPSTSVRKFVKYNVPRIVKQLGRPRKSRSDVPK